MTAIDCPVCNAPFRELVRDGVLIDECVQCKGVWLDRGELEKLYENKIKTITATHNNHS